MSVSKSAIDLLKDLKKNNVSVAIDGDGLLVTGDLSNDQVSGIKEYKSQIVEFLKLLNPEMENRPANITVDPNNRYEPFPLNENQQAYWLGRDAVFDSGEVAIHLFVEMASKTLNLERVEAAWRKVVAHHDMLRAVVLPDGRQQVLQDPPAWSLPVHDLRRHTLEAAETEIEKTREELEHYCADLTKWPSWKLDAFRHPSGENHLLLSLDCWSLDGRSAQIIAADFALLCEDLDARLPRTDLSFRDYMIGLEAEKQTQKYQRALDYWQERIKVLPPAPKLPVRQDAAAHSKFVRHEHTLPASVYENLKREAAVRGLTVANVLITVYAEVLGRWSEDRRFTLNIPRWNRHPLHEDVDQIVGEFATFELLEVELRNGECFSELARRLQAQFAEDLNHDIISGVRILRDWRKHHGTDPGIAMPFVFTHEPDLFGEGRARAYMASFNAIAPVKTALTQTPQVWIDAQYHDVDGNLYLVWDALAGQFPDGMVEAMFHAYSSRIAALGADDAVSSWNSPRLSIDLPPEQQSQRKTFNETERVLETEFFHDALCRHASERPDALAVADQNGEISYAELKRQVDSVVYRLQAAAVSRGTMVAVAMEKGAEQVVSALALHAIGAVCVPLDPDVPAERLSYMAMHCEAALLLTTPALANSIQEKLTGIAIPILFVHRDEQTESHEPVKLPDYSTDDLHCVLYTSGSTGQPKGVMVPLGCVLNVVADGLSRFNVDADARFISLTPFHHDLSLFDLLASITAGGAIILPDPAQRRDPAHWLGLIGQYGVSHWNTVPAMMTMLLDYLDGNPDSGSLGTLRTVILGGDWLPIDSPDRLRLRAAKAQLHSIGGPTETTIWNISYPASKKPAGWASIPYGSPIANNRSYVLNDRLEDCPDWVAGEMFCAGAGVTAGYFRDKRRTETAFIVHPVTGERLYRTGDRGRFRPDGLIEMLGRSDNQINLNGYRLELGEIETALARHPSVSQSIAVPMRCGNLVRGVTAWAVNLPGQSATEDELYRFLCSLLPRQMHPTQVRLCEKLPLTANGKVDRRKLEADAKLEARQPATELNAETPFEETVLEAWIEVLGSAPPSQDTSFFAAGGDSISAIKLFNCLLAGRVEGASVLSVFRAPTVRALADLISEAENSTFQSLPPVERTERDDTLYPATVAQARIWFEERVVGEGELYNLCFNLRVEGRLDPLAIEQAINQIIAQWEVLRVAIHEGRDGEPVQVLQPAWVLKLRQSKVEDEAELSKIGIAEAETPFDLSLGQPLRAHLVSVRDNLAHLILTAHHTAVDGWTIGHFLDVLSKSIDGVAVECPELSTIDYARWEQRPEVRDVVNEQLGWWREYLADAPPAAEVLSCNSRPAIRETKGAIVSRTLTPDLGDKIRGLAKAADTTPYVTLMTCLAAVLSRLTDEDRVLLGTHVSLRSQPALGAMPGMMVNNIALQVDLANAKTFASALAAGKTAFMDSWERGLAPFNHVVRGLEGWTDTTRHPLYSISFTHENMACDDFEAGGMRFSFDEPFVARSSLDIDLAMADRRDGGIDLRAIYNREILELSTVPALLEALEAFVIAVCEAPETELSQISLANQLASKDTVVPDAAHSSDPLAMFDAVVQEAPDRPALLDSSGQNVATFRELSQQLDTAAGAFIKRGVNPGDTVALQLPRGVRLVAAMLGAWRCGAHFLAIPAGELAERVLTLLADAKPHLFVAEQRVAGIDVFHPDEWEGPPVRFETPPADDLAALIYTSGSTGRPNGVEFTKAALINRLHWQWQDQPFAADERCVARTSVAFVDFLAEIFAPLLKGHPVAVLDDDTISDVGALGVAVKAIKPLRLLSVPSLLSVFLENEVEARSLFESVKQWTVSGEPLPGQSIKRFYDVFPEAKLFNLYGSSETGADVTGAVADPDTATVSIGKPLPGLQVHIVDAAGQSLPDGLPGELYVSGAGLAKGYRDREDLNKKRFVVWNDAKAFRTGDRGMQLPDGSFVLLGRKDRQVKIRGQRIELGEVQARLEALDGVETAAVVLDTSAGQPQIVATYSGGANPDDVRIALSHRLSTAAIPSVLAAVKSLPRTAGGKIAYNSVAEVVRKHAESKAQTTTPVTKTEKQLAGLWDDVLGQVPQSRETRFFEIGGHSLAAARLSARIKRDFAIDFPVRWVIERNSLRDMAAAIDGLGTIETEEFVF